MEVVQKTFLKFIDFKELSLWDVKRYLNSFGLNDSSYVRLKDIFSIYQKKFNKKYIKEKGYGVMKKINFGGELFLRNEEEIKKLKGNLYEVPDNSIIYSKINLRHGCLYFHGKGSVPFGVSSEYPVFTFDDGKYSGEYLKMILRSEKVKNHLNSLTTGISKARIKVGEFLEIKIPFPSLQAQNRIVDAYNKSLQDALTFEVGADELEKNIEAYLMQELGLEIRESSASKGLQFTEFKNIQEWNLEKILENSSISSNKYKLVRFEDISDRITDGTHQTPTYTNSENGVKFISSKDVTSKEINWDDIKYIPRSLHEQISRNFKPKIGDIFLAKNGTTGVAAMLTEEKEFAIYVSLAHISPIREKINPVFFLDYINSRFAKFQFDKNLVGVGVPNLHLSKIRDARIPIPPLEIQEKIVAHISAMKNEISTLRKLAEELRESTKVEFEKETFS